MYLNEDLFIDFLGNKEILWTGINFAKAKFTQKGFDFSQEILKHYLHEWNMLILNDHKKYDIQMSFRKPIMQYDLSQVTKINKGIKLAQILTDRINIADILTEEEVCDYLASFRYASRQRYGLMFLVESFDTFTKIASIWVVIFLTETGQVVLCEKFLKTPGGFGTRNYWARAFYNLLFDIKSTSFIRWKNLVSGHDNSNP